MNDALNRRNFLAAIGAASVPLLWNPLTLTAAPLVADPGHAFAPPADFKPLRLGMIGVGGRGNALLGEILKSKMAEVVAICDINPVAVSKAQERCKDFQPKGYEKYQDLLADESLEAVVIATPVDEHHEMALAALKTGKNIYCEKPLGLNAQQSDEVHAAAKDYPKVFQVGFQWVYNANFRAAVEAAHAGAIGDIRYVHAQRHGGDLPRDKGKTWLFDRKRSGDIIVEQAVHEMNILCWGLKSTPTRACGLGGTNVYVDMPPGREIMDHYSLTMEFPGPVHVSYSHLYYAPQPLGKMNIYFFGTKGALDVMGGQIFLPSGEQAPAPKTMGLTGEDTFNAICAFLDKSRNGGKPDADSAKGLAATKTCVLGRTAIYEERVVAWDQIK